MGQAGRALSGPCGERRVTERSARAGAGSGSQGELNSLGIGSNTHGLCRRQILGQEATATRAVRAVLAVVGPRLPRAREAHRALVPRVAVRLAHAAVAALSPG